MEKKVLYPIILGLVLSVLYLILRLLIHRLLIFDLVGFGMLFIIGLLYPPAITGFPYALPPSPFMELAILFGMIFYFFIGFGISKFIFRIKNKKSE